MEGVQKHGGGGCEGVRWATVSMLQQAPSEASHRHSVDSTPATRPSPRNDKKNKKFKPKKEKKKTTQEGRGDGRRMHGVMLPWGTVRSLTMLG